MKKVKPRIAGIVGFCGLFAATALSLYALFYGSLLAAVTALICTVAGFWGVREYLSQT